jgi:phosphoglycerate dehydrogenase-like enzyme
MRMKIVFHGENARSFRTGIEAHLTGGHEILELSDALESEAERQHFRTAEVIVGIRLTPSMPRPERLRLYQAPAAGVDQIDRSALPPGCALCNAFGHEDAIAEYVMTALLLRHAPLPDADARLRRGDWRYWAGRLTGLRTELGGSAVGLLGYGHIGKAIAARAKAFGMRVTVANRTPVAIGPNVDESYGLEDLGAFMGSADAIVVSLPHTPATTGLVGAPELAAMRPDAVILNVGRGPVIAEQALFDALRNGSIGGAVIDTWYRYPDASDDGPMPGNLPFETLPNIVMTPHMSGWTEGTIRRRMQTIAENIGRLAGGNALVNLVLN